VNWIIVKKFPLETDLSLVSGFLHQRNVIHQIYEDAGEQVVAVQDRAVVEPLLTFLNDVTQGKIHIETHVQKTTQRVPAPSILDQIITSPVSSLLILLSTLGALLVYVDSDLNYVHWFTFNNFESDYVIPLADSLSAGEVWRLFTPAFLHFGAMHVIFNSLWVWDLGRRLEFLVGTKTYILFFMVTAIFSNTAQFIWAGPSLFGGMSGVVYAFVGFIMVSHKLAPHKLTAVPRSLLGFMLFWLLFCMTGIIDYFIGAGVANAAHLGGLIAGAVFALFTAKKIKNLH
jgi:GlpG protein